MVSLRLDLVCVTCCRADRIASAPAGMFGPGKNQTKSPSEWSGFGIELG
jgi:hypothetical protein